MQNAQRYPAETLYAAELAALRNADQGQKPAGWQLSPRMVRTFILGSNNEPVQGTTISRKIYGNDAVVERAIVTLMSQQGLMLVGEPGTAKSLLSELLAAAISGQSTLTVQGSAGLFEENIRYSWNYAALLKDGPSLAAMVPGPLFHAMQQGQLMRFEEITRCPTEVQDNLIPVMSDRILQIPELKDSDAAYMLSQPGFNIIATANLHDRGVNQMSSALKRRFNFETLQPISTKKQKTELVMTQVNRRLQQDALDVQIDLDTTELLITVFDELRNGNVSGLAVTSPTTLLSLAEAMNVAYNAAISSHYFGDQQVSAEHLPPFMLGTIIKDNEKDRACFEDYIRVIRRKRADEPHWQAFLAGCQNHG
ncbi:AAA family ATPase [Photobacterium sp. CCB-ST2H9]|uniref:ATP-binding protein n=1 Tax=Photobacterium sp. CCB-ST2H9 TaxID=2912855 RepID=UPI002005CFB7|nr:AAA family ATPase [Photobacterium sp. CCB-ST2H9]UTM57075.1 AAA family ATPase [Photobacterium sp. CCB-ST2H9]